MIASLAPVGGSNGSDSYLTITSDGLPLHSQIGLMELAQNDLSHSMMLSTLTQAIGAMLEEDDSDGQ